MRTDDLFTISTSTCVAAILVPFFLLFLWQRQSRRNYKIPSCLPCGYLETIQQMASPNGPWFLLQWAQKIGFIFRIRIPNANYVFVVGDPVVARDIMLDSTATKPFEIYGSSEKLAGASTMFSSNGERWRHVRKSVASAFSSHHIQRMNQVCHAKLEGWIQNRLDNTHVRTDEAMDPAKEMVALTLSIICEAAFEYEMNKEEADYFVEELDEAVREIMLRQSYNPLRTTWLGRCVFHRQIQRGKLAAERVQAICRNILETYRRKIINEDGDDDNDNGENSSSSKRHAGTIIECINRDDQYVNDQERVADIISFLVGGHDTTAYSLAWILLEIARQPENVERVRRELQPLSPNERLGSSALRNVVREVMRIHPVAAMGSIRQVHRDIKVNDDDNTMIPKGSIVFMPQLMLHRNPQCFEEPNVFRPDRWGSSSTTVSSGNTSNATTAFMPFSVGPRNCIGQALADAELHTVVSRLVMEYDFQVQDAGHADFFLTLKPSGVRLKVQKRHTTQ